MIPETDLQRQERLYTRNNAGIWRVLAYCASPSVTMENVVTKERENFGLAGSLNETYAPIEGFVWDHVGEFPRKASSVPNANEKQTAPLINPK